MNNGVSGKVYQIGSKFLNTNRYRCNLIDHQKLIRPATVGAFADAHLPLHHGLEPQAIIHISCLCPCNIMLCLTFGALQHQICCLCVALDDVT